MTLRRILFDTQLLIWAAQGHPALSGRARDLLLDEDVAPHFSAASIWEVAIKSGLGRADFAVDADALQRGLIAAGYTEVPIEARHGAAVAALPYPGPRGHKDPFDRIILAQSRLDGIPLATADADLTAYGEDVLDVR